MKLAQIRKALMALGAAAGVAVTALTDGHVSVAEWIGIGLAAAGALGVYVAPNEPKL